MSNRKYPGKLTVNKKDEQLEFDVLSASLDRSFTYNDVERKKNLNGYSLIIDSEGLSKEIIRDFEEITGNVKEFFKVSLNVDGEPKEGEGKISRYFTLFGFAVDLELYN